MGLTMPQYHKKKYATYRSSNQTRNPHLGSLVIADSHFNLPQGSLRVCMGEHAHLSSLRIDVTELESTLKHILKVVLTIHGIFFLYHSALPYAGKSS